MSFAVDGGHASVSPETGSIINLDVSLQSDDVVDEDDAVEMEEEGADMDADVDVEVDVNEDVDVDADMDVEEEPLLVEPDNESTLPSKEDSPAASIPPESNAVVEDAEAAHEEQTVPTGEEEGDEGSLMDIEEEEAAVEEYSEEIMPNAAMSNEEEDEDEDEQEEVQASYEGVVEEKPHQREHTEHADVRGGDEDDNDELDIISLTSRSSSRAAQTDPAAIEQGDVSVHEQSEGDDAEGSDVEPVEPVESAAEHDTQEQMVVDDLTKVGTPPTPPSPVHTPTPPRPRSKTPPLRAPLSIAQQVATSSTPLSPPRPPPAPVIIEVPSNQDRRIVQCDYSFGQEAFQSTPIADSRTKSKLRLTVPPLANLPAEFNRSKVKPQKQRKRDKDREKNGSDVGKKDEWVPLGMARWAAVLRANPSWKRVTKATKCVSSREWNVSALYHLDFQEYLSSACPDCHHRVEAH